SARGRRFTPGATGARALGRAIPGTVGDHGRSASAASLRLPANLEHAHRSSGLDVLYLRSSYSPDRRTSALPGGQVLRPIPADEAARWIAVPGHPGFSGHEPLAREPASTLGRCPGRGGEKPHRAESEGL